jgi:hypothetical protein
MEIPMTAEQQAHLREIIRLANVIKTTSKDKKAAAEANDIIIRAEAIEKLEGHSK